MTRKDAHIALRYALLGSVFFAVSCTTSTISTPSFSPTAALENIPPNSDSAEAAAPLPESTTIVPVAADGTEPKPVDALALNPTAPSNAITELAATPAPSSGAVDEATSVAIAAVQTTPDATETPKAEITDLVEVGATDPAATATPKASLFPRSTAEPTGIFAFFKKKQEEAVVKSAEETTEPAFASTDDSEAPQAEKTVRITTAAPKPRTELKKPTVMRALPGVKVANIFGISKATDAAKKVGEDVVKPVQLASASIGSAARSIRNGIQTQHDGVSVKCFRPELVKMIKRIERHYGKPVVVTSGYRSPKSNQRAGGSKKSLHMYCAAADVQVKGVSKWALAKYIRSMPGRGGVGTYCHTKSVHLDIGSKRDWNWRCRRK